MKCIKHIILFLILFVVLMQQQHAQYIDTVTINQTQIYQVLNGSTGSTFTWFLDNNKLNSETDTIIIKWNTAGIHNITVIENSIFGCEGFPYQFLVLVNESFDDFVLEIPNAISPNNDGINDLFQANTKLDIQAECTIYNRWGNEIHKSNNIHNLWNGQYKGKDVPCGTYFYVLEYWINGTKRTKAGFVYVSR